MLGIVEFLARGMKVLLSYLWKAFKSFLFLFVFVAMLMVGIALKNFWIIIIAILGLITSMGAFISDRNIEDTSYVIKGKRVPAKRWLKVKEYNQRRFTAKSFWSVLLFIIGLFILGYGVERLGTHIILGMFVSICGLLVMVVAFTVMCN